MNIATVQDVQMVETGNGGAPDSSHASQRRADLLMQSKRWRTLLSLTMLMAGCLTACNAETPAGAVSIDGSSTVYPLSKAMAEAFGKTNPGVKFQIEFSGTGGGFKRLCAGQIDIAGASRPINTIEIEECTARHIEYIELPVAFDTLSLVVNTKNTFADCLTVNELRRMWEPAAARTISTWRQIRPSFPADPLVLFSPGKDSGTFDYFTLAIVGSEGKSRGDVTMSEDDMVIQRGVAANPHAIGYLGHAYYQSNRETLKLVSVDNGHGCVAPSTQTVIDATYEPLSRPLFIYVNAAAAARPGIEAFTHFYLSPESEQYVSKAGYVPLPPAARAVQTARFEKEVKGSAFGGRTVLGVSLNWFNVNEEERINAQLVQ
ncbi:PstS family phosphate ABC transporter substrate-binding protein [Nitrospira defluvii]|uniref:Phosphate-binding protein n=1 Tax=Nitrospira defluvii TaxID=330214 RepID=A0ABN7KTQ7_9BACT|nr:PstS family phosphate ABC transporter substrate-binding protein [Nitrospira defluvii]CAE6706001.1 Protein SphX [Nitrospira defluvii]